MSIIEIEKIKHILKGLPEFVFAFAYGSAVYSQGVAKAKVLDLIIVV